jgi:hypothetical protein
MRVQQILFESILRPAGPQKRFYIASGANFPIP